ncbi:hypothetical protein CGCTS75_v004496 [Colletotrichum tropicale]|nr:hypothetical protein CGCTS75_v004496 [Colletotrichum tropicale]
MREISKCDSDYTSFRLCARTIQLAIRQVSRTVLLRL